MTSLKPTKMLFQEPKVGSRVGAVQASDDDTVRLLGYGVRIENSVPPPEVPGHIAAKAREANAEVPCLMLDDDTIVWGVECHWAPEGSVKNWIGKRRVIHVKPKRTDAYTH